jgi:O-antigen/teichoic acid export membrane protein
MRWWKQFWDIANDPVRVAQWFMLCRHTGILLSSVVIARTLPLGDVGIFEMLMLSGYLVTFFWSEALLKGYLSKAEIKPDKSLSSGFIWLYIAAGVLSLSLLVAGEKFLIPLFTGRASLEGLGLFAIYQAMVIVVWIAPFVGTFSIRYRQWLSVFVLAGPPLACWLGINFMPGLKGILLGLIGYALIGMVMTLKEISFFRIGQVRELLRMIWPATWPLIMYAISAGLARSFDSWLVSRQFDETQFAVFRYGAREFPLVVALAGGLSTIMIPKLFTNEALPELRERSVRLMHICYPVVFILMLCSPMLFAFFFGAAYKPGAYLFNIYLLITLTQLVFPQSILTARGDTRLLWYISLAELVVNVIASLILLSYFGLEGIAFGTLIAFAFEKVVLLFIVARRFGLTPGKIFNPYVWLGYSVLLVMAFNAAKWIAGV